MITKENKGRQGLTINLFRLITSFKNFEKLLKDKRML